MRDASPPLLLPSTSHRTDIPEAEMPPQKRACFTTPAPGLKIGGAMMEVALTTLEGVDQRVTELDTPVRQRTEEFRDRQYHLYTATILDREAMYARITWTSSKDMSAAIEAHVRILEAHVTTLIAQTSSLQTQLTIALRRIETLKARNPEPQDESAEAGSIC
ncbi:hypothetical protein Tco_1409970 [Tanacetum coccineum]